MTRLLLVAALLLPLAAVAQSVIPLTLPDTPLRPESIGLGGATVAVVTDDPTALFDNPAMLAASGQRPSFRVGSTITPDLYGFDDLIAGSGAATVGLRTSLAGRPLTVGLGGGYAEINIDRGVVTGPKGELSSTQERAYGGGLGLGWEAGPVRVRAGALALQRESFEERLASGAVDRDRVLTLDLGTAVTAPLLRGPAGDGETAPAASVTAAVSYQNIALSTDFFERELTSSFVPTAPEEEVRIGLSASGSWMRQMGARGRFRIAQGQVSIESRSGFASTTHVGAAVTLAETVTLRAGLYNRKIVDDWTSYGASVSIDGLVRAIGVASESAEMFALSDRLTSRIDFARLDAGGDAETGYVGFSLGWRP